MAFFNLKKETDQPAPVTPVQEHPQPEPHELTDEEWANKTFPPMQVINEYPEALKQSTLADIQKSEAAKMRLARKQMEAQAAAASQEGIATADTITPDAAADDDDDSMIIEKQQETIEKLQKENDILIRRNNQYKRVLDNRKSADETTASEAASGSALETQREYREHSAAAIEAQEEEEQTTRRRRSGDRTYQIKTRLNSSERKQFRRRVSISGLTQGEFMRQIMLNEQVIVKESPDSYAQFCDELTAMAADIGRMGGLLKMCIKPNEGQRELNTEEWNQLVNAVREMKELKTTILKYLEQLSPEQELPPRATGES